MVLLKPKCHFIRYNYVSTCYVLIFRFRRSFFDFSYIVLVQNTIDYVYIITYSTFHTVFDYYITLKYNY
jgi:hypothetical protein